MAEVAAQRPDDSVPRMLVENGIRTQLAVPLRKDGRLLGIITANRREVQPFSGKQIALLENFAAQAVIAMENARLLTETREALEQQTATSEVLQVINSSPGDLAPVFDAMLEKAVRLCDFAFAALWTYDGTAFHPVALHGMPPAFEAYLREHTPPAFNLLHHSTGPIHFPDVMATEMPLRDPEFARVAQQLATVRTLLLVPLRKDAGLLGAFVKYRQEVRPFSDKQISLLQNFAAQAVIAMENARLLTETREALEQQTATAEVLQVINSSPGELVPVFDAILDKAHTLCGATLGSLFLFDGELFRAAATHGYPEDLAQRLRQGVILSATTQLLDDSVHWVHNPDLTLVDNPTARAVSGRGGVRTNLMLPLRKDGRLLGAISCNRQEVRPFSDKQIALLQNFAAQAVIAMENARLLTETREALEQQTATAEVLQVINSSPGDLTPVFDAIVEKAHTLCGAVCGSLQLWDGEKFRGAAMRGFPEPMVEALRQGYSPGPNHPCRELIDGGRVAHCIDMAEVDDSVTRLGAKLSGIRTVVYVGLRKDDALLGQIVAGRLEVRPFSDAELALLENFAAQAVIAMENARLLAETREALEQRTATAEVLQVINASPGDLAPVFDAMLQKALSLCRAAFGQLVTFDGAVFRAAAWCGYEPGSGATTPTPGMALYQLAHGEEIVHIPDITADDVYRSGNAVRRRLADEYGGRTAIWVALRKDSALLGAFVIYRTEVRPFTARQIALLQNFAAQAVIAIENARLITETREALEQRTATAEILEVINRSPADPEAASVTRRPLGRQGPAYPRVNRTVGQ
jgi:GAF domain-containing protein